MRSYESRPVLSTVVGSIYILYGVLALALMLFVLAAGKKDAANIWLSAYLFIEGTFWAGVVFGPAYILADGFGANFAVAEATPFVYAALLVDAALVPALVVTYMLFVGHALHVPITAWSRGTVGHIALAVLAIVGTIANWLYLRVDSSTIQRGFDWVGFTLPVAGAYGIVAAVSAWRRATHGAQRARMKAYMVAFIIRDALHLLVFGVASALAVAGYLDADGKFWDALGVVVPVGYLAFIVFLGWGVLRGNLIDLQSKLHFTVSRTTIAAVFVAVFVGVQTLVSEFVASTAGLMAGAGAAALLVFALAPLQRAANRIADRAVPKGSNSSSMDISQQEAFYREQVEIAYSDGTIGVKERQALRNVRERLGLSGATALKIEDSVVASAPTLS